MALIDIGSQKQLFLDDYLIESMTQARQGVNPAFKVAHNPIIRSERPWEGNHVGLTSVVFDDEDGVFKMWYSARNLKVDPRLRPGGASGVVISGEDDPPVTCLATSEDGIHWERPVLGLVEYDGSRENNIVPPGVVEAPSFLDRHERDPAKRYKAMKWTMDTTKPMQSSLYYSPDGFAWTPCAGNPVIDTTPVAGRWGPTYFMGWDPIRETYAAYVESSHHMRTLFGRRLIGRAESPDMIHWTEPETVIVPDADDYPDTEFYRLVVIPYAGLYVGLLWIFRTTNLTPPPRGHRQPRRIPLGASLPGAVYRPRRPPGGLRFQQRLPGERHRARRPRPPLLPRHQPPRRAADAGAGRRRHRGHRAGDLPPGRIRVGG